MCKNASRVAVWLGEGTPEHDVFAFFMFSRVPSTNTAPKMVQKIQENADVKNLENLYHDIRRRDWFRRVLNIQEVVLALEVLVRRGKYQMPWGNFLSCWTSLEITSRDNKPGGYNWADVRKSLPRISRTRGLVGSVQSFPSWSF
jgi:hypothetical protein